MSWSSMKPWNTLPPQYKKYCIQNGVHTNLTSCWSLATSPSLGKNTEASQPPHSASSSEVETQATLNPGDPHKAFMWLTHDEVIAHRWKVQNYLLNTQLQFITKQNKTAAMGWRPLAASTAVPYENELHIKLTWNSYRFEWQFGNTLTLELFWQCSFIS